MPVLVVDALEEVDVEDQEAQRSPVAPRPPEFARKLLVDRKVFWSALQGTLVTGRLATILNVPSPAAFLVKTVAQDSLAWNMGLQGSDGIVTIGGQEVAAGGDIILSVDGIPLVSEDHIEQVRNRLAAAPPGTLPWFDVAARRTRGTPIAFGHWSTLGPIKRADLLALDTGCVWGGALSAVRVDGGRRELVQVRCAQAQQPARTAPPPGVE